MKLFGFEIGRTKRELVEVQKALQAVRAQNTFWGYVRESFTGAWQQNFTASREETLSYFPIYGCVSLIAQDISKMGIDLIQKEGEIWAKTTSAAFSPVLVETEPLPDPHRLHLELGDVEIDPRQYLRPEATRQPRHRDCVVRARSLESHAADLRIRRRVLPARLRHAGRDRRTPTSRFQRARSSMTKV